VVLHRHDVAHVPPAEVDLVDVGLERQVERQSVVVDNAVFDVVQLARDA